MYRLSQFHGGVGTRELTSNPGFQRVVELLEKQAEYLSDKVRHAHTTVLACAGECGTAARQHAAWS